MGKSTDLIAVVIGGMIMVAPAPTIARPASQIEHIARETTILIDGLNPGSGVIIAHEGDRYTVLTARHVVATEDEYEIITADGREYPLNYATVVEFPDVDLAMFEFQSDRSYATATLAVYPYNSQFPYVFVSGWTGSVLRDRPLTHHFSPGLLLRRRYALINSQDPLSRGYGLFYTNITDRGMSGGPILDTEGRVIGIHGRSEGEEIYQASTDSYSRLQLGFSSGIPIQIFMQQVTQVEGSPPWITVYTPPPPLTLQEQQSIQALLTIAVPSPDATVVDWTNYGNQLFRLEQFAMARDAFNYAIRLQPDFYQAWYGQGQVLMTQGRYEEALDAYNQVLQMHPDFSAALRDRALLWMLLEQPQSAIADFDQAVAVDPTDYIAWYLRGHVLRQSLGWYDAALGAYDRAIALAPNFAEAWSDRGRTLYDLHQPVAALASLQQATRLYADLDSAWYWQGQLLYEQQEFSQALSAVEQALRLNSQIIEYWLLHSHVLLALDRPEDARESLQQAIVLDPTDPRISALAQEFP